MATHRDKRAFTRTSKRPKHQSIAATTRGLLLNNTHHSPVKDRCVHASHTHNSVWTSTWSPHPHNDWGTGGISAAFITSPVAGGVLNSHTHAGAALIARSHPCFHAFSPRP